MTDFFSAKSRLITKRFWRSTIVILFCLAPAMFAHAQGVFVGSSGGPILVNTPAGLRFAGGATITVCSSLNAIPCTTTITICKDAALSMCSPAGGQTNPFFSDFLGNWGFYITSTQAGSGCFYTVTGTGITGQGYPCNGSPGSISNLTVPPGTPTTAGQVGYGSGELNVGDGSINHVQVTRDATETLTNKTLTSPTSTGTDSGTETLTNKTLTSPTSTGTDSGSETLTNKTLTSPVVNGTPTGTGIPTITLKKGSGSGNYTSSSTSYVDVDATNLAYTATIPTGWKLAVAASGSITSNAGQVNVLVSIFDSSTLLETSILPPAAGGLASFALSWVINGDGSTHTIKLQDKTSNGANSVLIANNSATLTPTMVFILSPSN
jgi:hypothetical protein